MRTLDLKGRRFGKLTVVAPAMGFPKKNCEMRWMCECDCGAVIAVKWLDLINARKTSCGRHYQVQERLTEVKSGRTTHSMSHTPEYKAWHNLLKRKDVCDSWMKFENFLADVGQRPSTSHYLAYTPTEEDKQKSLECCYIYRGPSNTAWKER